MELNLDAKRSPSAWRNMLEARVRRLSGTKPVEVRRQALDEIVEIALAALAQEFRHEHQP